MYTYGKYLKGIPDESMLVGTSKGNKASFIELLYRVDPKGRTRKQGSVYSFTPKKFNPKKYKYLEVFDEIPTSEDGMSDTAVATPTGYLAMPKSNPLIPILFIIWIILLCIAGYMYFSSREEKPKDTPASSISDSSSQIGNLEGDILFGGDITGTNPFDEIPAEPSYDEDTLQKMVKVSEFLGVSQDNAEEQAIIANYVQNPSAFLALDVNKYVAIYNSNLYLNITNYEANGKSISYSLKDAEGVEITKGTLKPGKSTVSELYTTYSTSKSKQKGTIEISASGSSSVITIECEIISK